MLEGDPGCLGFRTGSSPFLQRGSGRRVPGFRAAPSSLCRTWTLRFSFWISSSRWHISIRSAAMPSSTTLEISATAAFDRASTTEAICARRATTVSMIPEGQSGSLTETGYKEDGGAAGSARRCQLLEPDRHRRSEALPICSAWLLTYLDFS